jgi:hypothetical protein
VDEKSAGQALSKGFDPAVFGEAMGLAQQYIFYYIRETERQRQISAEIK